jgi:hypothetical protein
MSSISTFISEQPLKKMRFSTQSQPLYTRARDILDMSQIDSLVEEATKKSIARSVAHGRDESKCFCFNACVKWSKAMEPQILEGTIHSLISNAEWDSVSELAQKISLDLIKIAGQQAEFLDAAIAEQTTWVCFELIRVPTHEKVPGLVWHRDPGYLHSFDQNYSCYADYTTVFMLTDPDGWKGGFLELQKNGVDRDEKPPLKRCDVTKIKYCFNEAVTFYNKDSRHRVTEIHPKNNSDRIVFIASLYGEEETKLYLQSIST